MKRRAQESLLSGEYGLVECAHGLECLTGAEEEATSGQTEGAQSLVRAVISPARDYLARVVLKPMQNLRSVAGIEWRPPIRSCNGLTLGAFDGMDLFRSPSICTCERMFKELAVKRTLIFASAALACAAGIVLAISSSGFETGGTLAHTVSQTSGSSAEAFMAENRIAMDTMMTGMSVKPSGDVDRDFTAMMIPHHQGAIAMAQAELRHGHNEQLRRIAQEIIVEQQQEIVAMRVAVGPPRSAPTLPSN